MNNVTVYLPDRKLNMSFDEAISYIRTNIPEATRISEWQQDGFFYLDFANEQLYYKAQIEMRVKPEYLDGFLYD
jgi:hypothetical protein